MTDTATAHIDAAALPAHWRGLGARIDPRDEPDLVRALSVLAERAAAKADEAARVGDVLAGLRLDGQALTAMALSELAASAPELRNASEQWGETVAALVEGVRRMPGIQALLPHAEPKRAADHASQVEQLRKMLLAMAQDSRVVLIHLARHLVRLRHVVREGTDDERRAIARETFDLLAPLANRLGVWALKWEMEDLAFRARDPGTYHDIARQLDEKRADRERFIADVTQRLRLELDRAGLKAEVTGRPKHIYSIWKKMQRKDSGLEALSDIRAVRILVEEDRDCYTALGIVHNLWVPIPREFDDYIARPKANSYRSLHTAVIGPRDKVLEVQIRTRSMHQANELGIAAHWRYKEGGRRDLRFEERIAWLRQVLDWRLGGNEAGELAASFRAELFQDTLYVLTPQGRVVALPAGSTPVDFAYHVHSDLGHRCRGAKVNGNIVPLSYRLQSGQRVEIVAAREGGPSRDWLNPALGFLQSSRARTKVRQWFNSQSLEQAIAQGRAVLDKEVHRTGVVMPGLDELARGFHFSRIDDFLAALGRGEIGTRSIQTALRGSAATAEKPAEPAVPAPVPQRASPESTGVLVVGLDRLLTQLARCCRPVPPDPIVGFVTRGRGVSVHRAECPNVARLAEERRLEAHWGDLPTNTRFAVDVELSGEGGAALLRDVADVLGRDRVPLRATRSAGRGRDERLRLSLEVTDQAQLDRVLMSLRALPRVSAARRC